ncbi:MAG: metallophosphoesterase [Candidatus Heimdallarchaeota archaeon]
MTKINFKNLIKDPQRISFLNFEEISNTLQVVKELIKDETVILEFNLDTEDEIYVIGDIHGNLQSLRKMIELINKASPKGVIFLGDIVDRGPHQLECLILVLSLKIIEPHKFYLLKGNHETLEMNQYYGFFQDFISRFNDKSKFNEVISLYKELSLCALINNSVLCLHGGIPEDFSILEKLKKKRYEDLEKNDLDEIAPAIFQILWNDPKEIESLEFSSSYRGSGIKFFGQKAFDKFMEQNNLQFLIRAHECFPEGYRWFFNRRLLSIFSSADYRGLFTPNPGSYAIIKGENIIPILFK